jgi:secondary thiamine-phosphate synthase enzyme
MSYAVITDRIALSTRGDAHMVDLTDEVARRVTARGLREGQVLVFVPGSTGAVTTIEYEPGLLRDFPECFDRIAPRGRPYHHDETWHDGNGYAHVRAGLLGPSLSVPVSGGKLLLGTWQQIVFVDFDNRARRREIVVQLSGVLA